MNVLPVTAFLLPDEKAYGLLEAVRTPYTAWKRGNEVTDFAGYHRYQIVVVSRGDRLAVHTTDMGLSDAFVVGPFHIPSLWEHTVSELRYMAEQQHDAGDAWQRQVLAEAQGGSDMRGDLARYFELGRKNLKAQSVFGPGISIQRNHTLRKKVLAR